MTRLDSDFSRFMAGIEASERLILAAYGANGGNVLLCGAEESRCFDDGFKALEIFRPDDPVEREAVACLYGAAAAAHGIVGDGTSTTVLLTAALIKAGRKLRDEGRSAREVVSAIRAVAADIVAHMKEHAEAPSESDICSAVTLAMHGDSRVGGMLGSFLHKAGENGVVVAQSVAGGKEIELIEKSGLVWKAGVASKAMLGNATRKDLTCVHVIMCASPMADMQNGAEWRAINNAMTAVGGGSFLLICPDASGTVLSTFIRASNAVDPWCIVGVPDKMNSWAFLSDLAEVIGGRVIDDTKGNIGDRFDASWFGVVDNFYATETSSCVEMTPAIAHSMNKLKARLTTMLDNPSEDLADNQKNTIKERLAFLSGFYGSLNIPYMSQSQFSSVWESVQDGVLAGRAALKGVLPGCSKALIEGSFIDSASDIVADIANAFRFTWDAQVPAAGKGLPPLEFPDYWSTLDTRTSKVVHAREAGILDSFAVLEAAVNIAVSVSIPIIEANILIVVEEGKDLPAGGPKPINE